MIHETGYWKSDQAEKWHVHSKNLNEWIINFLSDKKESIIYDFGCGMGDYLYTLHLNGFKKLMGFEMEPPKKYEEFEIKSQNLAIPFLEKEKGVVISLEVGEHIPPQYQDIFVDNITNNCSDLLILSWAIRGQGGLGHFNELNNNEIIPEIEKRGFEYLEELTLDARKSPEDAYWYFRNTLMIFKRKL